MPKLKAAVNPCGGLRTSWHMRYPPSWLRPYRVRLAHAFAQGVIRVRSRRSRASGSAGAAIASNTRHSSSISPQRRPSIDQAPAPHKANRNVSHTGRRKP